MRVAAWDKFSPGKLSTWTRESGTRGSRAMLDSPKMSTSRLGVRFQFNVLFPPCLWRILWAENSWIWEFFAVQTPGTWEAIRGHNPVLSQHHIVGVAMA
ncbi:hypothetical protein NQZ68_012555 [Dissostichus eleginoides]|nr:hypothetical protein NQZ68_012555 [Dissostichus eleginoides]